MKNPYDEFLKTKDYFIRNTGFEFKHKHKNLFNYQIKILEIAIKAGKFAIFADCGMGKTLMQLSWADNVLRNNCHKVLILAPLAVSDQTVREGLKFKIDVNLCESNKSVKSGINITNYEKLEKFDCSQFDAIVLDESSILKNYTSKFKNLIIDSFKNTKYKLACSATPAPNDYMELGNHSEFLDIMSRTEMLSEFFIHDGGETQKWRLKGHAQSLFWQWINQWSINIKKPSDLGFSDDGFTLPELKIHDHIIRADYHQEGFLFPMMANTLSERRDARNLTIDLRTEKVASLINDSKDQWIVWCNLNKESELAESLIPDSKEVKGSDSNEYKKQTMLDFIDGKLRVLITKPSIAGFGMNFQNCNNMAFLGLSDSYEQFYQSVRRCWRYGQTKDVNAHIVISDTEGAVIKNIKRKENQAVNFNYQTNLQG